MCAWETGACASSTTASHWRTGRRWVRGPTATSSLTTNSLCQNRGCRALGKTASKQPKGDPDPPVLAEQPTGSAKTVVEVVALWVKAAWKQPKMRHRPTVFAEQPN